jgi:hypothetical protein
LYSGAAYVYLKPASGWKNMTETAQLSARDATSNGAFGWSVSISADTVAIGAAYETTGSNTLTGAVYVFVKPANGWQTTSVFNAELTASDGVQGDLLGSSVSVSSHSNTVVAGNPARQSYHGAVYVFVEPAGGWASMTETAKLTATDGMIGDYLGNAVSIGGDTVMVGAYQHPYGTGRGAVYFYAKPASGWRDMTQTSEFTSSDEADYDWLGYSVSVNANSMVAGSPQHAVGGNKDQGAGYVFGR